MSTPANILLTGGSGFLSGTIARHAVAQGHNVWAVTRGSREYYNIIADVLGASHPPAAVPQTPIAQGLEEHVNALLELG